MAILEAERRSNRTRRAGAPAENGRAPAILFRDAKALAAAENSRGLAVAGRRSRAPARPSARSAHREAARAAIRTAGEKRWQPYRDAPRCYGGTGRRPKPTYQRGGLLRLDDTMPGKPPTSGSLPALRKSAAPGKNRNARRVPPIFRSSSTIRVLLRRSKSPRPRAGRSASSGCAATATAKVAPAVRLIRGGAFHRGCRQRRPRISDRHPLAETRMGLREPATAASRARARQGDAGESAPVLNDHWSDRAYQSVLGPQITNFCSKRPLVSGMPPTIAVDY